MLLAVDVGNTQTHFGTLRGDELVEHWRFATVRQSTADELGSALRSLLELDPALTLPDGARLADALEALEPGQDVRRTGARLL